MNVPRQRQRCCSGPPDSSLPASRRGGPQRVEPRAIARSSASGPVATFCAFASVSATRVSMRIEPDRHLVAALRVQLPERVEVCECKPRKLVDDANELARLREV